MSSGVRHPEPAGVGAVEAQTVTGRELEPAPGEEPHSQVQFKRRLESGTGEAAAGQLGHEGGLTTHWEVQTQAVVELVSGDRFRFVAGVEKPPLTVSLARVEI